MPRVLVLFLGGTISMTRADSAGGLRPDLAGAELLEQVPVPDDVVVTPVDVSRVDSAELTFATCLETFALADTAVRRGEADGVVVVQGTDTLEETAYLWDLLWSHPQPFTVTGAMRASDAPGADGPANLVAALGVASSVAAAGAGVLVVVADEVHAARHVAKRHSTSPSAFASPDLGPVGHVHEGRVVMTASVPRRQVLAPPVVPSSVALLRATLDDDPALYRAAGELSDGLVVEGFGAGQVRPEAAEELVAIARTKPVVLASRTGAGPVARRTYAGPASGSGLLLDGVVGGGRLGGLRSRVLLRLLLGAEQRPGPGDVAAAFAHHGG